MESIQTLKSTDAGVAFVVQTEDVHLYHAGDLNWWAWPDDTPEEAAGMKQAYWAQLDKLRGQHFDLAFVPLDPRLENGLTGVWTPLRARCRQTGFSPCISGMTTL